MSDTQRPSSGSALDATLALLGGLEFDAEAGYRAWCTARHSTPARVFEHRSHAIQAAMQAERAGSDPPLVIAALTHDVGHALAAAERVGSPADIDDLHEIVGADWLRERFVAEVSEPVRHHVAAKRYLVATRSDYLAHLGDDSVRSLSLQGGAMTAAEIEAFRALPGWEDGVRVRIFDDDAKVWDTPLVSLQHFLPLLESVLEG